MDRPISHPSEIWLECYCLLSRGAPALAWLHFMTLNSQATIFPSIQKILLITHSSGREPSLSTHCCGRARPIYVHRSPGTETWKCPEFNGLINLQIYCPLSAAHSPNHCPVERPVQYLLPANSIQQCTEPSTCMRLFCQPSNFTSDLIYQQWRICVMTFTFRSPSHQILLNNKMAIYWLFRKVHIPIMVSDQIK